MVPVARSPWLSSVVHDREPPFWLPPGECGSEVVLLVLRQLFLDVCVCVFLLGFDPLVQLQVKHVVIISWLFLVQKCWR